MAFVRILPCHLLRKDITVSSTEHRAVTKNEQEERKLKETLQGIQTLQSFTKKIITRDIACMSRRLQITLNKASAKNSYSNILFTPDELEAMQKQDRAAARKARNRKLARLNNNNSGAAGRMSPKRKQNRVDFTKEPVVHQPHQHHKEQESSNVNSNRRRVPGGRANKHNNNNGGGVMTEYPNTCIKAYNDSCSGNDDSDLESNSSKQILTKLTVNTIKRHSQQYEDVDVDGVGSSNSLVNFRIDSWIRNTGDTIISTTNDEDGGDIGDSDKENLEDVESNDSSIIMLSSPVTTPAIDPRVLALRNQEPSGGRRDKPQTITSNTQGESLFYGKPPLDNDHVMKPMAKYKLEFHHRSTRDQYDLGGGVDCWKHKIQDSQIDDDHHQEDGLISPYVIQVKENSGTNNNNQEINCDSSKDPINNGITIIVNSEKDSCDDDDDDGVGIDEKLEDDDNGKFTFISKNENHNVVKVDSSGRPEPLVSATTEKKTRQKNDQQQKENKTIAKPTKIIEEDDQQSESSSYNSTSTRSLNRRVNYTYDNDSSKLKSNRRSTNKKQEETSRRLMIGTPTSTTTRADAKSKRSHHPKRNSIGSCTVDLNPADSVKNQDNKKLAKRLTLMKNLLSFRRIAPSTSQYGDDAASSIMNTPNNNNINNNNNNNNNSSTTSQNTTSKTTDLLHPLANMNAKSKAILLQRRRTLTGENNIVIPGGWEIQHQKNTFQGNRELDELSYVSSSVNGTETDVYEALRRCKYLRIPQHLTIDD